MAEVNTPIVKNLTYVVKSAMNRLNAPVSDLAWLEQLAIEWMTEDVRGTTSFPCFKVKHLPITAAKQVQMPSDILRYTKIAINIGGKLWTLSLNTDIKIPPDFNCESEPDNLTTTNNGIYFMPYWWGGMYYGAVFAMGGGFNQAYYRYDEASKTLVFLGDVPGSEVVVEYLSTGEDVNSWSIVPHQWINPMRQWLMWQCALLKPEMYRFDPNNMERLYNEALFATTMATGNTIYELMDAYYEQPGLKLR